MRSGKIASDLEEESHKRQKIAKTSDLGIIIHEYEQQNRIERITEEELLDLIPESTLWPNLYLPEGGKDYYDCIIISDYEWYLLDKGINLIEGDSPEYLEYLRQTEDGIDLGDVECMSQGEFESEQYYDFRGMRTETEDVYCTDADDAIKWYYAPMDVTTLHRRIHCDAGDGKFLIIKTDAEYFFFYGVYLEFEYDEDGRRIELGTCTDPDDVIKIIMYYINTGESYGHR